MSTLYQKYRPQTFAEVVNQLPVKQTIINQLTHNTLGHAYLFAGPRGVGKTTMARLLARAVNCLERKKGSAEPCNKCLLCKEIQAGRCLDIMEVDAASHTGVDHVRENIIAAAQVSSGTADRYKVFIIDEVHMLSSSAFNALLKTLEEPPRQVLFILATTELHKLPATIISRCQRFNFSKIAVDELVERLVEMVKKEKREVENSVLKRIAKQSEGCLRDAEVLLGQVLAIDEGKIGDEEADLVLPRHDLSLTLKCIELLIHGQTKLLIELINQSIDDGLEPDIFSDQLMSVIRYLMIQQIYGESRVPSVDDEIYEFWRQSTFTETDLKLLTGFLNDLQSVPQQIKDSAIPQLPLELLVLKYYEQTSADVPAIEPISPPGASRVVTADTTKTKKAVRINTEVKKPVSVTSPTEQKTVTQTNHGASNLTLKNIQTKWSAFIDILSEEARSLSFIFGVSEPLSLNGRKLRVGLQYALHRERLSDINVKRQVEDLAAKVFGTRLEFEAVVQEVKPLDNNDTADVNEVLTAFGGQLVA